MKHLKSLQLYEAKKISDDFWQEIDFVTKKMIEEDNFSEFHNFDETRPKFYELKGFFHDKVIVPLHNKNVVKKNVSLEMKIVMYMMEMAGYGKAKTLLNSFKEFPDFKTWFETANLTVYRGVPAVKEYVNDDWVVDMQSNRNVEKLQESMQVKPDAFKSFTLDKNTALKFTQSDWAGKGWIDLKERNGWVVEGNIKPCDIHIFQNEGHEEECVIKGPFKCDKYYNVLDGKISS